MLDGIDAAADTLTRLGEKVLPQKLLRWSLGVVFFWFGALKLISQSPVIRMVRDTYPPFASPPLLCLLTLFEVGVGAMLLANLWSRLAASLIIFHLLATFGVLIFAPRLAFASHFPILTIDGEFVVKNLVLVAAAFAIATQPKAPDSRGRPPQPRESDSNPSMKQGLDLKPELKA